jgi:hypothetical protein
MDSLIDGRNSMDDDTSKTSQQIKPVSWDEAMRLILEFADKYQSDGETAAFLVRIVQVVTEFKENFSRRTVDLNNFLSISDMESLVQKLNEEQRAAGFHLLINEIRKINEKPLVEKKNGIPRKRNKFKDIPSFFKNHNDPGRWFGIQKVSLAPCHKR